VSVPGGVTESSRQIGYVADPEVRFSGRAFIQYWPMMQAMSTQRANGTWNKSKFLMLEEYVKRMGNNEFLRHARQNIVVCEIA
jgi:hypothetical protein